MKTYRPWSSPLGWIVAAALTTGAACRAPKPAAEASQPAAAIPVVTVHAHDFGFDGPAEAPAGLVTWHLVNDGPGIHHLQIVRLDSAKTVDDLVAAFKQPSGFPGWMVPVGGPNAVEPGAESSATLDLEPGSYALICLVDLPDHVPHVAKGMARAISITAPTQAAQPAPSVGPADLDVTLRDFAIEMPDTIPAGHHLIQVRVEGQEPHELVVFKLKSGATAESLLAWGATYQGVMPATVLGGLAVTAPGRRGWVELDLTPGTYVMVCFVPDRAEGKPHVLKGMMRRVTVT